MSNIVIKPLEDYTQEEWDALDGGTQADILWEYKKYNGRMQTLNESFREYDLKQRFIY